MDGSTTLITKPTSLQEVKSTTKKPIIPKKIQILNIGVDIKCSPSSNDKLEEDELGIAAHSEQEMIIRSGMKYDLESDTVFHEMLHWQLYLAGLTTNVLSHEDEEKIVSMITSITLDTLRRNKNLREYLFQEK